VIESAKGGRAKNAGQQAVGQVRADALKDKLHHKGKVLAELMPQNLPVHWHAGKSALKLRKRVVARR